MAKELFNFEREPKDRSYLRWRVDYELCYDSGASSWSGYYWFKGQAIFMAFYHKFIGSWGGTAYLTDQYEDHSKFLGK